MSNIAYERLIVTVYELAEAARALMTITSTINARQHAGQSIEPDEWAELYAATNATRAALELLREQEGDV